MTKIDDFMKKEELEKVILSEKDLDFLELMEEQLAGGSAGALIYCYCKD